MFGGVDPQDLGAPVAPGDEKAVVPANKPRPLFVSVVAMDPFKAKRAAAGHLQAGDIGLAVHKLLWLNWKQSSAVVCSEPTNLSDGGCPHKGSLVFSPSFTDWQELRKIMVWQLHPELAYAFDHHLGGWREPPAEHLQRHISSALSGLASAPTCILPQDPGKKSVLQHYAGQHLVDIDTSCGFASGLSRCSLSEEGRRRFVIAQRVGGLVGNQCKQEKGPWLLLRVRKDVPVADLSVYELIELLDGQGWSCVVADRKLRKEAKKCPHTTSTSKT